MKEEDFKAAMSIPWVKVEPSGSIKNLSIDLTKAYNFQELEAFILNLANYEGVTVHVIGKSVEGRNIYSISINMKPKSIDEQLVELNLPIKDGLKYIVQKALIQGKINNDDICAKYGVQNIEQLTLSQLDSVAREIEVIEQSDEHKPLLLFSGQIHASEFAGSVYLLKQFDELLKAAQTDSYTRLLLENVRFEAVPLINPDGREYNINNPSTATSKKSNINGVDLSRNFPAVNASQLVNGYTKSSNIASSPGQYFYAGPSLGSEPETQAIMKWLHVYVPQATIHYDYHQQGRGIYVGKPWDAAKALERGDMITRDIKNFLNQGINSGGYIRLYDSNSYCYDGCGATITDYAVSVARGMKYSPKYGVLVMDINGVDTPLMKFRKVDWYLEYKPINPAFQSLTIEITRDEGYGNPLGYSEKARQLMNEEYYRYHFDKLLVFMSEYNLGKNRVDNLKQQVVEIEKLDELYVVKRKQLESSPNVTIDKLLEMKGKLLDSKKEEAEDKQIS